MALTTASTANRKGLARSNTSAVAMRCNGWPPGPAPQ
jgi:hypothetical protein